MEQETYQRALHSWAEWQESIMKSRVALGYDAKWPVAEAVAWIEANYSEGIAPQGRGELRRLNLPANLQTYWEDCLYCDYLRPDGSADFGQIRRRIAYQETDAWGNPTGGWLPGNQSLPELPYRAGLVWYPGEDPQDFRLRIEVEVHSSLASRDLLESAVDQACQTLRHRADNGLPADGAEGPGRAHPLAALIARAKANQSERKRAALERWQRGEVDFEGLLAEEWQVNDIQEELETMVVRYRGNPARLRRKHRDLQKKVYDRVRWWFPEPKPRLKVREQWRRRLELPERVNRGR